MKKCHQIDSSFDIDVKKLRRAVKCSPEATKVPSYVDVSHLAKKSKSSQTLFNHLMKWSLEFVSYSHKIIRTISSSCDCACELADFCARCNTFKSKIKRCVEGLRRALHRPDLFSDASCDVIARKLVIGKLAALSWA